MAPTFYESFRPLSPALLSQATIPERQGYQDALRRYLALQSPLDYAQYVSPDTEEYAHIVLLNALVVALVEDRLYATGIGPPGIPNDPEDPESALVHPETGEPVLDRLFVTMPPRHGKSYLISEHTPPWYLTRFPDRRIILSSYAADFAADWGRKGKKHIQAHGEFGIKTDPESQAKAHWDLDAPHRGGMDTAGAGGPITGKGANLLVIDDPIKNDEEAFSETDRQSKWDWLLSTAQSRMEPSRVLRQVPGHTEPIRVRSEGKIILVHTRWHEDDLGGRCMKHQARMWYHIDLPALAIEGVADPLGRAPGEALCPARYPRHALEAIRDSADTGYWFGALYQQRPSSEGSGIFARQHFRYWTPSGTEESFYGLHDQDGGTTLVKVEDCLHFQTIDLAATDKTSSDFTVIATWAATPNRDLLLVGRHRERILSADHSDVVRRTWFEWKAKRKMRFLGVEKATYGLSVVTTLRREAIPIRPLTPDKDKTARAIPAGELAKAGKLYFPRRATWLEEWEHEHLQFPNGTHDDQVDTTAYAVEELQTLPIRRRQKEAPEDRSPDARIKARLEAMISNKRRRTNHPELGRL